MQYLYKSNFVYLYAWESGNQWKISEDLFFFVLVSVDTSKNYLSLNMSKPTQILASSLTRVFKKTQYKSGNNQPSALCSHCSFEISCGIGPLLSVCIFLVWFAEFLLFNLFINLVRQGLGVVVGYIVDKLWSLYYCDLTNIMECIDGTLFG